MKNTAKPDDRLPLSNEQTPFQGDAGVADGEVNEKNLSIADFNFFKRKFVFRLTVLCIGAFATGILIMVLIQFLIQK